jgi:large subunit ribosomal protein L23
MITSGQNLIKRPVISEKSFSAEEVGKYIFHVTAEANKDLIKKEVEKLFKVEVKSVNIVNIPGKRKRAGRIFGKRRDVRKAIVTLKKGQEIKEFK